MKISVTFTAQDRLLEAGLFIPERNEHEEPVAAVLIEGAMTGGAKQISERVARSLCDEGLVCMVLDHAFYKDDSDSAASWESPAKRVADIVAALSFLKDHSIVNPDKIVALGISVGAEYMTQALQHTDICKGFVILENHDVSVFDVINRLDIPATTIHGQSWEVAADDAAIWINTLFSGRSPLQMKDFIAWDSMGE